MVVLWKRRIAGAIISLTGSDITVKYLLKIDLEFCDTLSELQFKELSKIVFRVL